MSVLFGYLFVSIGILTIGIRYGVALECYDCDNINSVNTCTNTTHCASGQSCYLNVSTNGYRFGCIDNQLCGGLSNVAGPLIGRSLNKDDKIDTNEDFHYHIDVRGDFSKRDTAPCLECCSTEICNKDLCQHLKPTACIDNLKVDCALMNSLFSICKNIHEAKVVCPKFCGLCSLVDGNWADWSVWSGCDVTCGIGSRTRTRTCTNPPPVAGGLECPGSAIETQICSLQLCPVHGGWTLWFSWEPCSVTCDIGIQRRHRNCSNPSPERFGDHCFGDSLDVRICQPGPCANGGWSSWGTWSSCSTTCGGGMMSRSRTCTNPRPSESGRQCEGDPLQYISCNNDRCSSSAVAFRSKGLHSLSAYENRILVFTQTILNIGNGYNNNTGVFTAPVAGAYSFACQLCMQSVSRNAFVYAIVHNSQDIISGVLGGDQSIDKCENFDTFTVLRANDTVWVRIFAGGDSFSEDPIRWNMFAGMLVHD